MCENLTHKKLKEICKYEHISCSGTKGELCSRIVKHIDNLDENKTQSRKGVYSPEKYFDGLSPKEREKRLKEIRKGSKTKSDDSSAYKPFITDFKDGKKRKTKTSSYTQAFKDMFPDVSSLEEASKATGIPVDILKKVYDRGLAAWRTGHRPGATQGQWAYARVYSFIMKGCTYYFPDHLLAQEAIKRSSKAKQHWDSVTCICKKGCVQGKR